MFVKKDLRKIPQILEDPDDERKEIKLFRRGPEFVKGPGCLFKPEYVQAFKNLEYLSLYGNSLRSVDGIGVIKDSPLQRLNLGDNLLHELPEEFGELKQLKHLWLDDNDFEEFPGVILGLEHLETLSACGNKIKSIPPEIRMLPALTVLSFGTNAIEKVPSEIEELQHLTHIDLSGNRLQQLPASIGTLEKLEHLVVSSNEITSLPSEMARLASLRRLRVNKNKLRRLEPWLVDLLTTGALRQVNAANNELVSVPVELHGFLPPDVQAEAAAQGNELHSHSFPHPVEVCLLGNSSIQVGLAQQSPEKKARPDTDSAAAGEKTGES